MNVTRFVKIRLFNINCMIYPVITCVGNQKQLCTCYAGNNNVYDGFDKRFILRHLVISSQLRVRLEAGSRSYRSATFLTGNDSHTESFNDGFRSSCTASHQRRRKG